MDERSRIMHNSYDGHLCYRITPSIPMNKAHTLSNWINNIYCGDFKIIPPKTPFQYEFNGMDFITFDFEFMVKV